MKKKFIRIFQKLFKFDKNCAFPVSGRPPSNKFLDTALTQLTRVQLNIGIPSLELLLTNLKVKKWRKPKTGNLKIRNPNFLAITLLYNGIAFLDYSSLSKSTTSLKLTVDIYLYLGGKSQKPKLGKSKILSILHFFNSTSIILIQYLYILSVTYDFGNVYFKILEKLHFYWIWWRHWTNVRA